MQMTVTGASDKYNIHADVAQWGSLVNIYDRGINVCVREKGTTHMKLPSQQQNPCWSCSTGNAGIVDDE